MQEVVIFVGLQASGKTTYYNDRFSRTHIHISKDLLRNGNKQKKQMKKIEAALQEKLSIVVDNTNPSIQDRLPIIELGRKYKTRIICYYFSTKFSECMERNAARNEKIPEVGLKTTAKKLQIPSMEEGFDELFTI